jgi:aromatic ring-opening dioxygenase catalytic subunit (LigB family)
VKDNSPVMPVIFVSHGVGPWPYLKGMENRYLTTRRELARIPTLLHRPPSAVLVISGHWEGSDFQVSSAARPGMQYDYHGFPNYTYQITYPAAGAPTLADRLTQLLADAAISVQSDAQRGFDHGTFVPMSLMYPHADVPIVMMSLKSSLDPLEHIRAGAALAPLRRENVLILGSGSTYHNIPAAGSPSARPVAERFEQYLADVVAETNPARRNERLMRWQSAPDALSAHPRAEHLLPLMVVAGAAGEDVGYRLFNEREIGLPLGTYAFGKFQSSVMESTPVLASRQAPTLLF